MARDLRLSPQHGVNPSLSQCFYCGGDKNEIVLAGLMRGNELSDPPAPRKAVWNKEPCDECKAFMAEGVICIGVDEAKSKDLQNPWRTGHFAVVKDRFFDCVTPDALRNDILKQRVAFIPLDAWEALGLPLNGEAS